MSELQFQLQQEALVRNQQGFSILPDEDGNHFLYDNPDVPADKVYAAFLNGETTFVAGDNGGVFNADAYDTLNFYGGAGRDIANLGQGIAKIIQLYQAYFNRAPEQNGFNYWVNELLSGKITFENMVRSFSEQQEFEREYGGLSIPDTVEKLYQNVLGRESEPAGKAYWVRQLEEGKVDLPKVFELFTLSEENVKNTKEIVAEVSQQFIQDAGYDLNATISVDDNGDIVNGSAGADTVYVMNNANAVQDLDKLSDGIALFLATYDRLPNAQEFDHWFKAYLEGNTTFGELAERFTNSDYFKNEFEGLNNSDAIDALYEKVLDRSPDAEGKAYWMGQLDSGLSISVLMENMVKDQGFINTNQADIQASAQSYYTTVINTNAGNDSIVFGDGTDRGIAYTGIGQDYVSLSGDNHTVTNEADGLTDSISIMNGSGHTINSNGGAIIYAQNGSGAINLGDGSRDTDVNLGDNTDVNFNLSEIIDETETISFNVADDGNSYASFVATDGGSILEVWGTSAAISGVAQDAGISGGIVDGGNYTVEMNGDTISIVPVSTVQPSTDGPGPIGEDGLVIQDDPTIIPEDPEEEPVSDTPVDPPVVTDDPVTNPDPDDVIVDNPFEPDDTPAVPDPEPDPQDIPIVPDDEPVIIPVDPNEQGTIDFGTPADSGNGQPVNLGNGFDPAAQPEPEEVIDTSTPVIDTDQDVNVVGTQTNDDGYTQFNPF